MSDSRTQRVVVAMSGGVDSSVAAALLKDRGYDVVGCFMRLGSEPRASEEETCDADGAGAARGSRKQGCCSLNDAQDARLVAAMLEIPLYVLNFRKDFERIMSYFEDEYHAGRTPNPCIRCNDWLKFGRLDDYARSVDADFVATGHYAGLDRDADPPRLLRGVDADKDQSYVLLGQPIERLRRMLLPLGGYRKSQIREIARDRGLPVFDKPDSQEICFIPDNDYAGFVAGRSPDRVAPGAIIDRDGRTLGEHQGHQRFTVGQRRGVGLALGYPIYVVEKDPAANTVTVGPREALDAAGLVADQANWLLRPVPDQPLRCEVRIRHNARPVPARIEPDAEAPDRFRVLFDEPQPAVTPGQGAACYVGDQLVLGGWIREAIPVTADKRA